MQWTGGLSIVYLQSSLACQETACCKVCLTFILVDLDFPTIRSPWNKTGHHKGTGGGNKSAQKEPLSFIMKTGNLSK